ncbi:hypothetical protein KVT40_004045 [Elsinoe batatas]|uniref:Peptidase A1 domain-containing protein n=1 Tax=Elsinoe batatas TaxID=2601811 RepID=A0A8K0PH46_9PEZI|nr:hypothetical protein KVT40_004045 [Elsinoe batatas]
MREYGQVFIRAHKIMTTLLLVLPLSAFAACDPPITLPITNVSLANGQVRRGPVYDAGTFVATNQSLMRFMTDDLSLSSNVTLGGFPIGVPGDDIGQQQAEPQAILGLGGNSTLLSALRKSERISSRSYGIFSGLTGVTAASQMDGSLVLGGYDRAKTVFAREGDAFRACLIPDYPLVMSLTGEVFQRIDANFDSTFVDRSTGINFWGVAYDGRGGAPYDGDLTAQIEIAGQSLDIRIPNDQLVLPDITIAETGAMNVNYSKQVVMLDALAAETETLLPIIGRSFLSSAYVFVNQDAGTFTLWAANATTTSDIVPIARDGSIVDNCGLRLVGTDVSGPGNASNTPPAKLTTGAIAGIAVGGTAALVVIVAAAFFLLRRRGRPQGLPDSPDGFAYAHYRQSNIPYDPQEMVGSHFRDPHEVEGIGKAAHAELGASNARYELAAPAGMSELHDGKSPATTVSSKPGN